MKIRQFIGPFALCLFSLLLLSQPVFAGEANVFVYHRFGDSRYPSTNIDLEVFEAQLRYLAENQYQVLPLGEIARRLAQGVELPEHCAGLSIDDAYATFLKGAFPLLRKYQMPATLFVNTASVGGDDYMTWKELQKVQGAGIEIGNHSDRHSFLLNRRAGETTEQWRKRVRKDIQTAQDKLTEHLGKAPQVFAYPYGEFDPQLQDVVRDVGFVAAFGQQSGVIAAGEDLFTLPRFPMGGPYATLQGFREKVAMKNLPLEVLSPWTPVIKSSDPNPPLLVVKIDPSVVDLRRLNCFVPGQPSPKIQQVADQPNQFEIRADAPLTGRRSKYTLTAPGHDGHGWYWFSQLWVRLQEKGGEGG